MWRSREERKYEIFEAKTYKKQVVGYNYYIKVHIGENKHLELIVFVGPPDTNSGPVLQSVHESTDDQIYHLEQESGGVRFRNKPFICDYGFQSPEIMSPEDKPVILSGGIGASQPANPEVQAICDSVKSDVEEQRGEKYEIFEAKTYKKQVVGYNYYIKVHIGENKHLELIVFVGPPVLRSVYESTDDQIYHLDQEYMRYTYMSEPDIYSYGFRSEIMAPQHTGGIGESQPADPEVQALCDSVKSEVEAQRGEKYETFKAISYKKQTVYGYNYFVKVHVGEDKHLELFLYVEPDPNSRPVLRGVKDFTDDQISDLQQEIRDMESFPPQELIVGGIGESQPADPGVQAICDSVKRDVEKKRGEKYETFEAISYRTQVVAGTNYTVKVHIGQNKHLELVVFVGLPHTNSGPVLRRVLELAK
ncbi:hypothetical protein NL108_017152 [Boleophthalmus pectinirostris]|nr:hypothetical protein NL108_017152 [Boleophthalmus pectinirostris]